MSTEKLEAITNELERTGTLAAAELILSEVPGKEQYLDFLQQVQECIKLDMVLTNDLLNRIVEVVNETMYFECDYAALCD